ncbi:hypothetical protein [Pyrinomonas sp.]|uniref:hypothetical protein n=1 Tax=Pyrinomonas sp. TaxID=2080306 RepID=UPI00331F9E1A
MTLNCWALLLMRAREYDVIHTFSAAYCSYLLSAAPAILVGKLYDKKIVLNHCSGEVEDHLQNRRLTAVPSMMRF